MKRLVVGGVMFEVALLILGLTWISPLARRAHATQATTVVRKVAPLST